MDTLKIFGPWFVATLVIDFVLVEWFKHGTVESLLWARRIALILSMLVFTYLIVRYVNERLTDVETEETVIDGEVPTD